MTLPNELKIFCFGEEEKEQWWDGKNLEDICVFLF